MKTIIVGLGNPGQEYQGTRHNAGRDAVLAWVKKNKLPEPVMKKAINSLVTDGEIEAEVIEKTEKNNKSATKIKPKSKLMTADVLVVLPETFMNKSGAALVSLVKSPKQAEKLIVVYDDLDLPLGTFKISFDRSGGGHKGLESIIRSLKTKAFVRIRIGVSPVTKTGKIKKPDSGDVIDMIVGKFKPTEVDMIKSITPKVIEAITALVTTTRQAAMNRFN